MSESKAEAKERFEIKVLAVEAVLVKKMHKDPEAWFRDLVTDLMHCRGEDWVDNEVRIARDTYRAETGELNDEQIKTETAEAVQRDAAVPEAAV